MAPRRKARRSARPALERTAPFANCSCAACRSCSSVCHPRTPTRTMRTIATLARPMGNTTSGLTRRDARWDSPAPSPPNRGSIARGVVSEGCVWAPAVVRRPSQSSQTLEVRDTPRRRPSPHSAPRAVVMAMQTPGISVPRSARFCSSTTATPIPAPLATALRRTPMALGRSNQISDPSANTPTGIPHSTSHCTMKFSGCVKTLCPGWVRYAGNTLANAPRPIPQIA